MKKILVLFTLAVVLSACANNNTTVRKNAAFHEQELKTSGVVVLPTKAIVKEIGAFGAAKRMEDFEYYIERVVDEAMYRVLSKKGFKTTLLSKREVHNLKLSGKVLSLRDKYDPALHELYKGVVMDKEKAFNIDSNVGAVKLEIPGNNARFVVLCDLNSTSTTSGARTVSVMSDLLIAGLSGYYGGGQQNYNSTPTIAETDSIIIGIVDTSSGYISWTNMSAVVKDIYSSAFDRLTKKDEELDIKKVEGLIETALKPMFPEEKK